ncbi:MAG: 50S ribosomal protein L21 [Planctomycetes bacterium]|nr:50S ribosomal protein L21 [Planctomycetota bacterium]
MKYAVIRMGSKQFQMEEGKTVLVDLQKTEPGKEITFPEVVLYVDGDNIKVGSPLVKGAKVVGQAGEMVKDKKVFTGKHRRREGYKRTYGHRTKYTPVKVTQIVAG